MSTQEQVRTSETKTKQMEQELKLMSKRYEKLMDNQYIEQIEATNDT